jgi:hypothetical protein
LWSGLGERLVFWLKDVGENAQAGDADFDAIPCAERADAGGGSGEDEVAGFEGDGGGDVAEQGGDIEDEVVGRAVLAKFAVDAGFDGQAGFRIDFVANDGADRAEGVKALGSSPLTVFLLQVTGGYVVGQGVAADDAAPVGVDGEFGGAFGDDEGQFAFEVPSSLAWSR